MTLANPVSAKLDIAQARFGAAADPIMAADWSASPMMKRWRSPLTCEPARAFTSVPTTMPAPKIATSTE